jgi:hypothetical protein
MGSMQLTHPAVKARARRRVDSLYVPITALVLLLERPAMAEKPPVSPPEPAAQKEMREQAAKLKGEGRLADARDIHLSLWKLNHRPNNAFNVGMLSYRIHDFPTAAEYLTIWFDTVGPKDAPKVPIPPADLPLHKKQYEQAQVDLQQARAHVGALEVRVSDPGAEVLVDDRRLGVSPLKFPVFVNPGKHRVVAQLGATKVDNVVSVEAGGERTVRLELTAAQTPAPAPPVGPRADAARALPSKPSPWPRWQTVAVLAPPVALGVVGVAMLGAANGAADDRDAAAAQARTKGMHNCPDDPACGNFTAAEGRRATLTAISVGAFVGAGLSAAGAAVYLLVPAGPV